MKSMDKQRCITNFSVILLGDLSLRIFEQAVALFVAFVALVAFVAFEQVLHWLHWFALVAFVAFEQVEGCIWFLPPVVAGGIRQN